MKAKLITACGCEQWIELLDCCEGEYLNIPLLVKICDIKYEVTATPIRTRMFRLTDNGEFYECGLTVKYHIYREVLE